MNPYATPSYIDAFRFGQKQGFLAGVTLSAGTYILSKTFKPFAQQWYAEKTEAIKNR